MAVEHWPLLDSGIVFTQDVGEEWPLLGAGVFFMPVPGGSTFSSNAIIKGLGATSYNKINTSSSAGFDAARSDTLNSKAVSAQTQGILHLNQVQTSSKNITSISTDKQLTTGLTTSSKTSIVSTVGRVGVLTQIIATAITEGAFTSSSVAALLGWTTAVKKITALSDSKIIDFEAGAATKAVSVSADSVIAIVEASLAGKTMQFTGVSRMLPIHECVAIAGGLTTPVEFIEWGININYINKMTEIRSNHLDIEVKKRHLEINA